MTNQPQFLTVDEAAAVARAPIPTLRHWIRTGRLRAYKPGKRVLVDREVLMAFIKSRSPAKA